MFASLYKTHTHTYIAPLPPPNQINVAGAGRAGKTSFLDAVKGFAPPFPPSPLYPLSELLPSSPSQCISPHTIITFFLPLCSEPFTETASTAGSEKSTVTTQKLEAGSDRWEAADVKNQEEEGVARALAAKLPGRDKPKKPPLDPHGPDPGPGHDPSPAAAQIKARPSEDSASSTSLVKHSSAAQRAPNSQIVNEEATYKINEALVLKYVGKEEPLRLTLMDYGGQKVFLSLHRMFLKRRSVFVLVFNMMWLLASGLKDKCDETFEMLGGSALLLFHNFTLT
jgi:hypothetical protein